VDRLWGVPQRADYHPEVDTGVHLMMVLDMSARLQAPLPVRFACLTHDLGKGTTPAEVLPRHIGHEQRSAKLLKTVCNRLRVPTDCRELADVVAREHGNIHRSASSAPPPLVRLLERCDAFRKPQRFAEVLLACECDARGRLGLEDKPYPQRERLLAALARRGRWTRPTVAAEGARAAWRPQGSASDPCRPGGGRARRLVRQPPRPAAPAPRSRPRGPQARRHQLAAVGERRQLARPSAPAGAAAGSRGCSRTRCRPG
jgi:tRNA nucleotidyltransferase (CCA-adding enzyme)